MAKTRKALKLCACGKKFEVIEREGEINPYRLYEIDWRQDKYGRWGEHRRLVEKYATMSCALYDLAARHEFKM